MFTNHQPKIAKFAARNPDNFFQVIQFVLLTIQQPLLRMPLDMREVNKRGADASCLWGVKLQAWRYHGINRGTVYDTALQLNDTNPNPYEAEKAVLGYLATLPGLGLVKGGFVAQLAFGLAGCLDTHNVVRYNLSRSQVSACAYKSAKTQKSRDAKLDAYLGLCHEFGGCEALWDSWCEHVFSRNRGDVYDSAYHVSAVHCEAFGLN